MVFSEVEGADHDEGAAGGEILSTWMCAMVV